MPEYPLYLVAGLGNPGLPYAGNRHNVGFMVADALAAAYKITVQRNKFDVFFGRGMIEGRDVLLAKPQAYMNRSGPPLRRLADYFRIQREAMVVVHDDIDLAFQRLKIKEKGGDGGQKGVRSVIDAFGGDNFARVRMGVGRSVYNAGVVDHVLSDFNRDEQNALNDFLKRACQAIVTILSKGTKEGMNRFNQNPR
jgi:peptidyl-tRNA hydrolase, PTH1 family